MHRAILRIRTQLLNSADVLRFVFAADRSIAAAHTEEGQEYAHGAKAVVDRNAAGFRVQRFAISERQQLF